jgi:cytidyltransferase-like protein
MTSELLLEGGVAGHMSHLYDNYGLSFSQIKDVFTKAANGELEGTEKTDGQNLFISYDVKTGKAKGARNKGNVKDGGLDASQLAQKFGGRGALEFTFSEALSAFEEAVSMFSEEEQIEIFGPDTNIYYNCEIQDPRTANVINYDIKTLSIHRLGGAEFDRETGNKTDRDVTENAVKLEKALEGVQDQKKSEYGVAFDAVRRLKALDDKTVLQSAIDRLEAVMNEYGVSDNETIGDYIVVRLGLTIDKRLPALPEDKKAVLIKRILNVKGVSIKQVTDGLSKEEAQTVKEFIGKAPIIMSALIRPIEEVVHDFSVEMLKTLESAFVLDNKKEVERLRGEVSKAVDAIESSGSEEAMEILKKQMEKLKSVENISTAAEGFVFAYDGHSYKFTGNFAPMNQLLGLFKYGRGSVPALQKLDENESIEIITADDLHTQTVGVFAGSFKPPHKGHMAVVEYLAKKFDKVLVFVSDPKSAASVRMNLNAAKAAEIFNIYIAAAGLSDRAMAIGSNLPSPLTAAFTYAEKEEFSPRAKLYFAVSSKDGDRFANLNATPFLEKNPTLESLEAVVIPAITGPQGEISAKQLRAIIADTNLSKEDKEEQLVAYLPDFLEKDDRRMVYNIMMPSEIAEIMNQMFEDILAEVSRESKEVEEDIEILDEMSAMGLGSVGGYSGPSFTTKSKPKKSLPKKK